MNNERKEQEWQGNERNLKKGKTEDFHISIIYSLDVLSSHHSFMYFSFSTFFFSSSLILFHFRCFSCLPYLFSRCVFQPLIMYFSFSTSFFSALLIIFPFMYFFMPASSILQACCPAPIIYALFIFDLLFYQIVFPLIFYLIYY